MRAVSLAGYVWICAGYVLTSISLAFIVPMYHWTFFAMVVIVSPITEEIIKSIPFTRGFHGHPRTIKYGALFPALEFTILKGPLYIIDIFSIFHSLLALGFHIVTLLVYYLSISRNISLTILIISMTILHCLYNYINFNL